MSASNSKPLVNDRKDEAGRGESLVGNAEEETLDDNFEAMRSMVEFVAMAYGVSEGNEMCNVLRV